MHEAGDHASYPTRLLPLTLQAPAPRRCMTRPTPAHCCSAWCVGALASYALRSGMALAWRSFIAFHFKSH